jgi:hypothetical protein
VPAAAATDRTIVGSFGIDGVERVNVEAGVGEFELVASELDEVRIEVVLTPRRGGIFSSMKASEEQVEKAELSSEVVGRQLYLEISADDGDRRFEERWTVHLPASFAIGLEMGVGDVQIRGLEGGAELEVGVGDVVLELAGGDVTVDLGVGDLRLRAPADGVGSVKSSQGVGDSQLTIRGERIDGEGFVGKSASWSGDGPHRIVVTVGVGDAKISLE